MAEETEIQTAELAQPGSNLPMKGTPAYDEILRFAEEGFNRAKAARLQFEKQWYLNLAFYAGKQYVTWVGVNGTGLTRLVDPPAPSWKPRLVSNQIRRYLRKEHAKANREQPTGFVLPASGDEADIMAAKAGDQILEHLTRETQLGKVKRQAVWWACLTGNGFVKDWYNKANPDEDTLTDMPAIKMVSPFHIYVPDVVEPDIEGQEVVYQVGAKSRDYILRTYKVEVPGESRMGGSAGLEEKFFQALGVTEVGQKDSVYVREAWIKPCSKYPAGAVLHWTPGTILYFQEMWPYAHGEFPFTKLDHIPTGKFYSESMVTDLIPIQKEYNKTRSQVIEAKNKMANPQMAYQQGSVDTSKITSQPGQWIPYKAGFEKPSPIELQTLPSYVIQEMDRNRTDMDDISSQHEVSRGQAPPGVEAATAISYLQEQDDTVLSELTRSIEEGVEKVSRHMLAHVAQNWSLERQIQVVGLNNQLEAYEFSQNSIQGNTTYVVQPGSATPRSLAGKQAFIQNGMDKGWIPVATGLKYLDMAETGRIYEELQIDARHAQRENLKMSQGMGLPQPEMVVDPMTGQPTQQPIDIMTLAQDPNFVGFPTNSWDNDLEHITQHDNWRKRQEYEASGPEIKFLFDRHQLFHKRRLAVNLGMPLPPPGMVDPGTEMAYLDSIIFKIQNGIPLAPPVPGGAESQQQQGELPPGENVNASQT